MLLRTHTFAQTAFVSVSAILLYVQPCLAHEHEVEELGHHWAVPAYGREIHLQMHAILLGLALLCAAKMAARYMRGRSG
jgi:hypothetical protein